MRFTLSVISAALVAAVVSAAPQASEWTESVSASEVGAPSASLSWAAAAVSDEADFSSSPYSLDFSDVEDDISSAIESLIALGDEISTVEPPVDVDDAFSTVSLDDIIVDLN